MRSLVADDVTILRRIIENIIKPYFEVVLAENGQLAYDLFEDSIKKNKLFDVVFLDILMPKLDGIQTLQKMRQCEIKYNVKKKAKIIMITGLNDQYSVEHALQEGCNGYILKPYSAYNVLNALKKQEIDVEKMTPIIKNVKTQEIHKVNKTNKPESPTQESEPENIAPQKANSTENLEAQNTSVSDAPGVAPEVKD